MHSILFKLHILYRCQKEFEKNFRENKMSKQRWLGNIVYVESTYPLVLVLIKVIHISSFIGELYKQGLLTARIVHEVLRKLLNRDPSDPELLKCLIRLRDWFFFCKY